MKHTLRDSYEAVILYCRNEIAKLHALIAFLEIQRSALPSPVCMVDISRLSPESQSLMNQAVNEMYTKSDKQEDQ